ncbi:MAG: AAA family ATPase [Flavobacteriia bacterium]|nr:AAA family ATPase [Flavobacteriia bacterium]
MERSIKHELISWKNKSIRLPLILQGTRQVGKTYIMKWFGKEYFSKSAYFNFDERPELKELFQKNKNTQQIIATLSLVVGFSIDNETLVIFDEIQECPEALNSLKYFAEQFPEIPIVCAGSLLGILLNSGNSFPVGKVEFITLHPMTFREVLPYWDIQLSQFFEQLTIIEPIPEIFYNDLIYQFKKYMVTGGLPAVIRAFNENQNFESADEVLNNLILSYKGDFAKHPIMKDVAKVTQVFESLPAQLARENKKFVYQLIRSGARAREFEDAIQWLIQTGLVHKVKLNIKPALPVAAYDDQSIFKLYAFDVGVIRKLAKLSPSIFVDGNRLFTEFKGALIENYILQSLKAQFEDSPRYWTSGNTAEVDFLVQYDNNIFPIEVKSDENIKSKSLTLYQTKFNPPLRIRYSLKNLQFRDGLLNIPHFLADFTSQFIRNCKTIDPIANI